MINFMAYKPDNIPICRIYGNKLFLFTQPIDLTVG